MIDCTRWKEFSGWMGMMVAQQCECKLIPLKSVHVKIVIKVNFMSILPQFMQII